MSRHVTMGFGIATGTNTYAVNLPISGTVYRDGALYVVKFTNANTLTSTLNINGAGAKAIVTVKNLALSAGDISASRTLILVYDLSLDSFIAQQVDTIFAEGSGSNSVELIGDGTNSAGSDFSGVLSGENNDITGTGTHAAILSGEDNIISSTGGYNTILGGVGNEVGDDAVCVVVLTGSSITTGNIYDPAGSGFHQDVVAWGDNAPIDRGSSLIYGGPLLSNVSNSQSVSGINFLQKAGNAESASTGADKFLRLRSAEDLSTQTGIPFDNSKDMVAVLICQAQAVQVDSGAQGDFISRIDMVTLRMVGGTLSIIESSFAITAVATGAGGTFTVAGDQRLHFKVGKQFTISGSTNNDGTWTVASVNSVSPTVVQVLETVGATADGTIAIGGVDNLHINQIGTGIGDIAYSVSNNQFRIAFEQVNASVDVRSMCNVYLAEIRYDT